MPGDEQPWTPDKEQLAANLRHLRVLLDRRAPRFDGVSELQRAATLLCPHVRGTDRLQTVVQLAIDYPQEISWIRTAPLLYGLSAHSKGKSLAKRRQLAFEASSETSLDTWRTAREHEMSDDLATALVELVMAANNAIPSAAAPLTSALNHHSTKIDIFSHWTLDSSELMTAQPLSHALILELQCLCRDGLDKAHAEAYLPILSELADTVIVGRGSTIERTTALLRQAIDKIEDDQVRRKGITALLGLGDPRGLSIHQRRNLAAPDLGYETSINPERYRPKEESAIITALKEPLLALAVEVGITAE
jgi:hypothetical protein